MQCLSIALTKLIQAHSSPRPAPNMPKWAPWMLATCAAVVFGCGGGAGARLDEAATLSRGEGGATSTARLEVLVKDSDARVRAVALVGLVRVAPGGAEEAVLDGLEDPDAQVRAVAARAAGEGNLERASRTLAELARLDGSEDVRRQAVAALARLSGPESDGALAAVANDRSGAIRLAAIQGLSMEGARLAAPALAARAIGDVSWEVRAAAVDALARAEVPPAWAIAEAAALDGNEFVRAAAVRAVERLRRAAVPRGDPGPPPGASIGPAERGEDGRRGEGVYTPRPDLDAGGPIEGPPDSP